MHRFVFGCLFAVLTAASVLMAGALLFALAGLIADPAATLRAFSSTARPLPYYICDHSRGTMRVPADVATANAVAVRTPYGQAAFIEPGDKVGELACR